MSRVKINKKYLDSTIAFTQSSGTYKDPYQPRGNVIYKLKNKVQTFTSLRSIENEFVDFRTYHLQNQFRDIYSDLAMAYKRADKVILNRSLSQQMYEYSQALLKDKKPTPFQKTVNGLTLLQARIYANQDHLLPEDQWAQITMRFDLSDQDGERLRQYNVFERRLSDKLSFYDWKLCYQGTDQEFNLLHKSE